MTIGDPPASSLPADGPLQSSLLGLVPATYRPHDLHGETRSYPETNCWVDVFIELVHAHDLEPLAALGSCVRGDFEGDQWTFYKPRPDELELLYGLDVHEMQPYRSIPDQIVQQLGHGRTMLVELDSFYLPDTVGRAYRSEHVKTTVGVEAIDREGERLRYFHNAGYFELSGEDYRGVFRLEGQWPGDVLPPYTELVRFDVGEPLRGRELRLAAFALLHHHLARRPTGNPFERFAVGLAAALPDLLAGEDADYHDYAFATVRMVGSTFEILGSHLEWLLGDQGADAAAGCGRLVDDAKLLSFKLARRRPFDPSPVMERMAATWQEIMETLVATVELDGTTPLTAGRD